MKNLFVLFMSIIVAVPLMASDVLTLIDKADGSATMRFTGEIKRIKKCEVVFKAEGKRYVIPAHDIYSVKFGDENSKVFGDYQNSYSGDVCMKGINDAQMYHKSGGAFACGVLFGPFAVIGAAVINPSPHGSQNAYLSQNRELFSDPNYLNCYSRTARQKNTKNAALGWLSWIALILVAAGGAG